MAKLQITLDATKLRSLVTKRQYDNKAGEKVEVQEVKFELIEVKEPKLIFEKENMKIHKTHFACAIQTKEEREAKADTIYIGEGFTTSWENKEQVYNAVPVTQTEDPDEMPF